MNCWFLSKIHELQINQINIRYSASELSYSRNLRDTVHVLIWYNVLNIKNNFNFSETRSGKWAIYTD